MTVLYSPEGIEKLKKAYRVKSAVTALIGLAGLLALIIMCVNTGTLNASRMENYATLMVLLTGWLVIYLLMNQVIVTGRELKHAQMLASEEAELIEGEIRLTKTLVRINGSVLVRKVEVTRSEGVKFVNVIESRAKMLEPLEGQVKLYIVHGYVCGFES